MSFREGCRYTGNVISGSLIESGKGTPGFEIQIECDEGVMFHTIWMTPKTVEYAAKDFAVLDVTEEQLANVSFLTNQLPLIVQGKTVAFGTKAEEYKGVTKIRCAWIGKPKAPAAASLQGSVAKMFGGKVEPTAPAAGDVDPDLNF